MKIQILLGILAIILSVSGKQWNYKSRKACGWSNNQIEILVPQGVRVALPSSRSTAVAYGIEAYINREPEPESSEICDICVNSTTIAEPMFHPSAIIRAGDRFEYTLSYYYRSGSIRQYKCSFHVAEYRMKYDSSASPCSTAVLPTAEATEQRPAASDKLILEEIINDSNHRCDGISRMIVMTEPSKLTNRNQMEEYVAGKLESALPGLDWTDEIQQVYRSEKGLVIELKSIVTKRKLLRLIRDNVVDLQIVDFDLDTDEDGSGGGFW
ncbi:hypothetical protein AND_008284 [Anopheles darlingi]|uniref:CBM39 domain-containing protein n=1 Tax=Anopheles darlingi TaxID=43151 RepID=W5J804_ANODA|nr:hypothetical protein AND_008284 [Anopheles darlingi]